MNPRIFPRDAGRAGYTLLTTLILTGAITAMLAATLTRTMTGEKLNDRDNAWQSANAAAEAATEKVLSRMMVDFANGGEASLSNNMSLYRTGMLPNTNESSYWTNVVFLDGNGNTNATYVSRTSTNVNPQYVVLEQQYPGLSAFASTYRVLSNAKFTYNGYNITGVVEQDLQMAEIPVFQFAIFYNTVMEYSDCATFTINGRVHCNTNIDVGTVSGNSLTFNYFVDCSGTVTNPPNAGYGQGSWVGPITYHGTPTPGYGTGEAVLTLPIGTNSGIPDSVREIINPPPYGESPTDSLSPQRFFNKADMIILVTNALVGTNWITSATNVLKTNCVTVYVKNTMYDSTPLVFAVTNGVTFGTNNGINDGVAWTNWSSTNVYGFTNWLSFTNMFTDQREGRTNHVIQIDVGKLGTWIGGTNGCTNNNLSSKWNGTTPFNGIIYIQDCRATNANWMNCVRLVNGVNITNGLYYSGLTVATQNPLYIQGLFNCPNATTNQGTTNTIGCRPCSAICDAITILSPAWSDATSVTSVGSGGGNTATVDTVNIAIIAGNVLTTDTTGTGFSGGVMNLTRLLEDWGSGTVHLWLNTSLINLYTSVQAAKQFKLPGTYYYAPTRNFSFDLNYTTSTGLPPGTPMIDRMIRAGWGIAPPGVVTYNSPTLDFVPH